MIGVIIGIATVAALLGFFIGVRSKAVAKRKAIVKEYRQVENLMTITHSNPPPPPPPKHPPVEGAAVEHSASHLKPGRWSGYEDGTFVKTSKCNSCNTIGYYYEMWEHRPCPSCGGTVKEYVPCKWDDKSKVWIKSTAS